MFSNRDTFVFTFWVWHFTHAPWEPNWRNGFFDPGLSYEYSFLSYIFGERERDLEGGKEKMRRKLCSWDPRRTLERAGVGEQDPRSWSCSMLVRRGKMRRILKSSETWSQDEEAVGERGLKVLISVCLNCWLPRSSYPVQSLQKEDMASSETIW